MVSEQAAPETAEEGDKILPVSNNNTNATSELGTVPDFLTVEDSKSMDSKFPFLDVVKKWVLENGPLLL